MISTQNTTDILSYRTRHGMTQEDLAKLLRVDKSSVSLWEAGKIKPGGPAQILIDMLICLDVHPFDVFFTDLKTTERIFSKQEPKCEVSSTR